MIDEFCEAHWCPSTAPHSPQESQQKPRDSLLLLAALALLALLAAARRRLARQVAAPERLRLCGRPEVALILEALLAFGLFLEPLGLLPPLLLLELFSLALRVVVQLNQVRCAALLERLEHLLHLLRVRLKSLIPHVDLLDQLRLLGLEEGLSLGVGARLDFELFLHVPDLLLQLRRLRVVRPVDRLPARTRDLMQVLRLDARLGAHGDKLLLELGDDLIALLHLLLVQLLLRRQVCLQFLHSCGDFLLFGDDFADHVIPRLLLLNGRRQRGERGLSQLAKRFGEQILQRRPLRLDLREILRNVRVSLEVAAELHR
mmetsp:Transcript_45168/g.118539  ORF Transcript_45168/g.118539 Transcript_45168/m.118539 type:complete len:316 (+) Transcript_45168:122-1069(+)